MSKRPSARRVLSTKGVAVTGVDMSAVIRSCARSIYEKAEAGAKKREEQALLWRYDQRESLVCIARRVSEDKESAAKIYEVTTVQNAPGCDEQAKGCGYTIASAETELRFNLGQLFVSHGCVKDYDEARQRACLAELIVERSLAQWSR